MRIRFSLAGSLLALAGSVAVLSLSVRSSAGVPTSWTWAFEVDGGPSGLGAAIAATDSVAVVGAPAASLAANGAPVGAVYVYSNSGSGWASSRLSAPSPIDGGNFGATVAASGGLVAVGAPGTPPAAYVYSGDGGVYSALHAWSDPKSDRNASFGGSIAVYEGAAANYVAIAAPPGPNTDAGGIVYISQQTDGGAFTDPPYALTNASAESFAYAIAFGADGQLLVGDPNTGNGQVLVYAPVADGGWQKGQTLSGVIDGGVVQAFGYAVSTWNDLAVVTAPGTGDVAASYNGVAFVFEYADGGWAQKAALVGATEDVLGNFQPAINASYIAMGVTIASATSSAGQVDVWAGGATTGWEQASSLGLGGDSYYGEAVGAVGTTLFVGDTSVAAIAGSGVTSLLYVEVPTYSDGGAGDASVGPSDAGLGHLDAAGGGVDGAVKVDSGGAVFDADVEDTGVAGAPDAGGRGPSSNGGCSCDVAGHGPAAGGGAWALVAGIAIALGRRGRRRG